jgi:hypothetical protein
MCYHTSQWYNMVQYNGKKINTSMNLDEDLLKWIDTQIAKKGLLTEPMQLNMFYKS